MPQKIQRTIPGLRELTLTGTLTELLLSEIAIPTIDIGQFLCAMTFERVAADPAAATTANTGYSFLTVPTGQLWDVKAIIASTETIDADQAIVVAPLLFISGFAASVTQPVSVAASTRGASYHWFPQPTILSAGQSVGSGTNEITVGAAGSIEVTTIAFIHRLTTGSG